MMNRRENKTIGQCPQQSLNKIAIAIAMVAFSWLSVCSAASHAQRLHVYRPRVRVGPVAEKPKPPPPANAPKILDITNTTNGSVTIRFRDFAAKKVVRKQFVLERQTVGSSAWLTVYSKTVVKHRNPFDPPVYNNQPQPGAKYFHRDTKDLVNGTNYRYRVRETILHKSQPHIPRIAAV